ncbi:FAD-dependent oxidoreductase [Leptothrix discophora]|uniref:FAD-dependent oxidoreductase n=1 Tax=Leptothrix discophora TaxID=89 RepID=A0ABT9G2F7_LEPDI|nr:FAD-dependent oxidoreductase [Leptothrix discophora]MDP4300670.1 FAD-dependent oxidoreductase [Leptothrix discophora]
MTDPDTSASARSPAPPRQTHGQRRVVLLGGGHAHVGVLAELARQPLPRGWEVHLVSPSPRQFYSGMLPGWLAGHYPLDACAIRLDRLAEQAGVALHLTRGRALALPPPGQVNAAHQAVLTSDGRRLPFDLLSLDTGPVAALAGLPGAAEHALSLRPIEAFVAAWPRLVDRIRSTPGFTLAVLGAGAGGIELACAIAHRARRDGWPGLRIRLVGRDARPLPGAPSRARRLVEDALARHGIDWQGGRGVAGVAARGLLFGDGSGLAADAVLLATGAAAPDWPAAAGLACDALGHVRVDRALRSLSHPQVLAAGDLAALADARPHAGVYAVRAGPVLAASLRAIVEGRRPAAWTPQRHALYLLATGGRHAIATWGPLAWQGDWVWRWKDRIDRAFLARHGTVTGREAAPGTRLS